ncbi:MAG: sulfatase-like hydrolase/transferase [Phycisphaeraceae bacterium]|nr:sulfatase-like hydrolase/transferase [Phycisphaeraceae bacterium]
MSDEDPVILSMRMERIMTLVLAMVWLCLPVAAAEKPNIVLILSDDQAWTDYGFMGHPDIETPHLDALAERSLLFERGYVASPLCRPSLATMATGLYPHQHGVTGNDVDGMRERAKLSAGVTAEFHKHPSMIKALVANGYLAHQSGKWWEGSYADGGFTHGMTHGDPKRGGRHGDAGLKIGRRGMAGGVEGMNIPNAMEPIADFIDHAIEKDKPFFVWYAPFLPHTPHNPPERLLKKYTQEGRPMGVAKYYAMCEWFDETCGELLKIVDDRGLTENTVFLYICDNGWAAKSTNADDPNQKQWGGFALKSKGSPFENGIRTPIMVSWPGKVKPGKSKDFAHAIDLFPTAMAAAGLDAPADLPGINLMDREVTAERKTIFGVTHAIHNMTPGNPDGTLQYQWVISDRYKLIVRYNGENKTQYSKVHDWDQEYLQLFDLEDDPHEKDDWLNQGPISVLPLNIGRSLLERIESWHPVAAEYQFNSDKE